MNSTKSKIVLAFGVFDILHDGHRHFLNESKKIGDKLIIVLASDLTVKSLKGIFPKNDYHKRLQTLLDEGIADKVVPGDEKQDSWDILYKESPNIVALGYDQTKLRESLEKFIQKSKLKIQIVIIPPFKDETLHSSELRKKIV